ncbi:Fic family protein [Leucobacter sp. HY1910]
MGEWVTRAWAPSNTFGLSRRQQGGGSYRAYIPDLLGSEGPQVSVHAMSRIADAQSAVTRADGMVGESGLYLNHLLLRSESISSSYIEGHVISARRLALADALGRGKPNALAVIHNLRATEYAIDVMSQKWDFDASDLVLLQQTIAPQLTAGFRAEQNWIGGTGHSPLTATFVPPPEEHVARLIDDLLLYINRSEHPPLLKAAVAHAQFETIHPFVDGNGRTGRALIHAILKRDGVTENALLPISTVFSTDQDGYIAGLTSFRSEPQNLGEWVVGFADAATRAAQNVVQLKERATALDDLLAARFRRWREQQGLPGEPRQGSTASRLLKSLMSAPVLTVGAVQEKFSVSQTAAERALGELADAGVLSRHKDHRGALAAYVSDEHLGLVTLAERSNQAGGWDTADRVSQSGLQLPQTTLRWDQSLNESDEQA